MDLKYRVNKINVTSNYNLTQNEMDVMIVDKSLRQLDDSQLKEAMAAKVSNLRFDPLKAEASKMSNMSKCPICDNDMEIVELMRKRKAYYCNAHRTVTPSSKN